MTEDELRKIAEQFMNIMLRFYYEFQEYPLSKGRFKLSSLSFNILFRLYSCEERRITILELTEKMQISKPQLIKLVNNLEDKHLVLRERFKENRRIVYLSLSPQGIAYVEQTLDEMQASFVENMNLYSNEKRLAFLKGIQTMAEAMGM